MDNDRIFRIHSLLKLNEKNCATEYNIRLYGVLEDKRIEVFDFPTSSIDVGLMQITSWQQEEKLLELASIQRKWVQLNLDSCQFVITLLHV